MPFKTISILIITFFAFCTIRLNGQTTSSSTLPPNESFYSITRNKTWLVNQYYITSTQTDKKLSFKDSKFRFNQVDTGKFLIENIGTNSMVGHFKAYDRNKIIFSLPLIIRDSSKLWTSTGSQTSNASSQSPATFPKNSPSDSAYNKVVGLFSGGPMQVIELKPEKIKLRMVDPMAGEVLIELLKND